jgi:hypothetical protein
MRLAQATGWISLFAIAAVSIVPAELRPDTALPHDLEHAAIYLLTGCAFGLSYPNDFLAWLVGHFAFTLVIEVTQLWFPGRHARVSDFLVDVFCSKCGVGRRRDGFEFWLDTPDEVKRRLVAVAYEFNTPAVMPQSQVSSEGKTGLRIFAGGLTCADKVTVTLKLNDGQSQQVAVDGCRLVR